MFKKTVGVILSAGLVMAPITACSSDSDSASSPAASSGTASPAASAAPGTNSTAGAELQPEKGAVLTLWEDKEAKQWATEVAAAFKAKYNVEVKIEEVPAPDQAGRLTTDGPAGTGGDVVLFPQDKLGDAASAGLLLPNDVFAKDVTARSQKNAIEASTYKGILYGYPKSVETYALFYNKDLIPNPPKTWDEVIAFAKTFNDEKARKYAIMWEVKTLYYDYAFMAPYGAYVFGGKGTDATDIGLNNDGAVKGLTFMQSLRSILQPKVADLTFDIKTQLFADGKLAMNIDGPWSIGSFKDKINLGVAPLPDLPEGKKAVSFSGVRSYYVNTYTKYPKAARLLANFLTSKENQLSCYQKTGILPANQEVANDPAVKADALSSAFLTQFASSEIMPSIPAMASVWAPMEGAVTSIWDTNADVKATLDAAAKTIKEQIASGKK